MSRARRGEERGEHPDDPTASAPRRRRRWGIIPRVDEHLGPGLPWNPFVRQIVRDHRDGPVTPRARALWWLVGGLIVTVGIAIVIVSRR